MTDYHRYYLKTSDEAVMRAALIEAGAATEQTDGEQTWLQPITGGDISVIGQWFERTGGTEEAPEMSQVPGWHFNVISPVPIDWPASVEQMNPVTPWRVWG